MQKVSAIIPTYNRQNILVRAIESTLNQTRRPDEIIVVDDGSDDDTTQMVRAKYGDRVRVLRQPNQGVAAARNAGILAASHPLIAFLDSDDEWTPTKLERQLPLMENPNVVLSFTNWLYAMDGVVTHPHRNRPSGFRSSSMQTHDQDLISDPFQLVCGPRVEQILVPTVITYKNLLRRVGLYDERLKVAEDTRLLYRIAFEGAFASCHEELCHVHLEDSRGEVLTKASDEEYTRRHRDAMVETLMEAYARAIAVESPHAAGIRKQLSAYLVGQAIDLAGRGKLRQARRRSLEALIFGVRGTPLIRALALLASPRLFNSLRSKRIKRRSA